MGSAVDSIGACEGLRENHANVAVINGEVNAAEESSIMMTLIAE